MKIFAEEWQTEKQSSGGDCGDIALVNANPKIAALGAASPGVVPLGRKRSVEKRDIQWTEENLG